MNPTDSGEKMVNVRTLWENEAVDFTPWLAQNLDLLGQELCLKLNLVAREKMVGPFFLDILAKETDTDVLVAIENQLEWTDFSHLGQLLTYATGCDTKVAIWIAPEFRYEHAEALHRLNEWTVGRIRFYGVKIEAVLTNGDSDPKARFRKVVYPGGWNKKVTLPSKLPPPPEILEYQQFYEPLIDELLQRQCFDQPPIREFGYSGRYFPSPLNPGIWYAATLEHRNDAWVTLHIRTGDKDKTKDLFDALESASTQIESEIMANPAPEWHWRRHSPYKFSSISIRTDGSINDREKWESTRGWMLDLLPKFVEVFDPRVADILYGTANQDKTNS